MSGRPIFLNLPDASIVYFQNFILEERAREYFSKINSETNWQQDNITVFGKTYKQPRLTALYGEDGKSYSYSGLTMHPKPFTKTLVNLKTKIEAVCETKFNVVLLNLYRDGNDSNGWHSDDEKELGKNPTIASLSLGAERFFKLKHKKKNLSEKMLLKNGSLLIMKNETQHFWKHQIPKTRKIVGPRINLTFRHIL